MEIRNRQHYEVLNTEGTHGLYISNMDNEAFHLTVQAIDDAVERSKAQGYNNDEKWIIVLCDVTRKWDDNGMFLGETKEKKTVAFYDNGKVTEVDECIKAC